MYPFSTHNIHPNFTECNTFYVDNNHGAHKTQTERANERIITTTTTKISHTLRFINSKLNLPVGRRVNFENDNAFELQYLFVPK